MESDTTTITIDNNFFIEQNKLVRLVEIDTETSEY